MKDLEKQLSFWDFVKLTPEIRVSGGHVPAIRVERGVGRDKMFGRLTLRYDESYDSQGYDAWAYAFYFSGDGIESAGHVILDFHKKTLVQQVCYYGYAPRFQDVACVFFVDAIIYTHLPSLKSIALKSLKTCNP